MDRIVWYKFGEFFLDPLKRILVRSGERVTIAPKPFDMLTVLIERRSQVLTKDELIKLVWTDAHVTDNNFNVTLAAVRKALSDTAKNAQYIVTTARGYSFIADVQVGTIDYYAEDQSKPLPEIATNDNVSTKSNYLLEDYQSKEKRSLFIRWLREPIIAFGIILLLCLVTFLIGLHYGDPSPQLKGDPNIKITIDGHPHDWATLKPLLLDPSGDGPFNSYGQYFQGEDFLSISVTNDESKLYFLLEFNGDYIGGIKIFLDTDLDAGSGCDGAEYIIFVSSSASGAALSLADGRNCMFKEDYPDAVVSEARGNYVEAAVAIEKLRRITPKTIGLRIWAQGIAPGKGDPDNVGPPETYLFK